MIKEDREWHRDGNLKKGGAGGYWSQTVWIWILATELIKYVTLGNLLNIFTYFLFCKISILIG